MEDVVVPVHATAGEIHGLQEDTWNPYLTISYVLTKSGTRFKKSGVLAPMIATDALHYANGVRMDGLGTYHLTYIISAAGAFASFGKGDQCAWLVGAAHRRVLDVPLPEQE